MAVPSLTKGSAKMTWNALKEALPAIGYSVEQKKKSLEGKQQQACYITGTWHDVEMKDNMFMALVAAQNEGA